MHFSAQFIYLELPPHQIR